MPLQGFSALMNSPFEIPAASVSGLGFQRQARRDSSLLTKPTSVGPSWQLSPSAAASVAPALSSSPWGHQSSDGQWEPHSVKASSRSATALEAVHSLSHVQLGSEQQRSPLRSSTNTLDLLASPGRVPRFRSGWQQELTATRSRTSIFPASMNDIVGLEDDADDALTPLTVQRSVVSFNVAELRQRANTATNNSTATKIITRVLKGIGIGSSEYFDKQDVVYVDSRAGLSAAQVAAIDKAQASGGSEKQDSQDRQDRRAEGAASPKVPQHPLKKSAERRPRESNGDESVKRGDTSHLFAADVTHVLRSMARHNCRW